MRAPIIKIIVFLVHLTFVPIINRCQFMSLLLSDIMNELRSSPALVACYIVYR